MHAIFKQWEKTYYYHVNVLLMLLKSIHPTVFFQTDLDSALEGMDAICNVLASNKLFDEGQDVGYFRHMLTFLTEVPKHVRYICILRYMCILISGVLFEEYSLLESWPITISYHINCSSHAGAKRDPTPDGRISRVLDSLLVMKSGCVGGRGFAPQPGAIVKRVFHPARKLVRFSLLKCPSISNSKFGSRPCGKCKLQTICVSLV